MIRKTQLFMTDSLQPLASRWLSFITCQPTPRWLAVPVMLRALFLPFFLLCNYRPSGVERLWPAMMHWDHAFWGAVALFGLTGGLYSSLAMMYCPRYYTCFFQTWPLFNPACFSHPDLWSPNTHRLQECLERLPLSPESLPALDFPI